MEDFKQDNEYKVNLGTWRKILSIVFKKPWRVVLLVSFATLLAVMDTIIPLLNRYAIDTYFSGAKDMTTLPIFIVINVLVAVIFGLSVWGFIHQAGVIEANTSYQLRKEAFKNIQNLSFSYFDKTPQGWLMARLTSDARRLSLIISWGLVDLVWALFSMILILVVLVITNIKLAVITLISVPIMLAVAYYFRKVILKHHRNARKQNSQLTAAFSESFLGAKTTKSLVIEEPNFIEFEQIAISLRRHSIKAVLSSSLFSSIVLVIAYLAVTLTMFRGGTMFLEASTGLKIGVLSMFITYTINFFEPVMSLSRIISDFQNAQASAERIVGLIETKSDLEDTDEVKEKYGSRFEDRKENWEPLQGDVEFKDVTFYYKDNEIILENFNLKIKAGSQVALVGHTGSGKTTIVNLLSRFYEPKAGEILIDGVEYRKRSIHWLHKRLGYVLQSPHLFSTTIMENIRYGRLDATDEEVIEAAKAIGAHEFIEKLDKGYDTYVGEGGNFLSIGQKQLLSFARAILANPRILILDEATSSIDSETEQIVQEATRTLLKDRTSVIVAHRLSTIVDSDLIIMLADGKIIEMGNHKELLEKRGAYFDLYRYQFFKENEAKI